MGLSSSSVEAAMQTPSPELDMDASLRRLGGDRELLCTLIDIFREDGPPLLRIIVTGCAKGEWPGVERAAHALRGMAMDFNASTVATLALKLERMGEATQLRNGASALAEELDRAMQRLTVELERWRERVA